MKKLAALLLLFASFSSFAKDHGEAKITYVGMGRYTCSGDSYKCAQIDANNRTLDAQREMRDRERTERERELRRQDLDLYRTPRTKK